MKTGAPRQYKSPEQMQRIIDLYFLAVRVHQTGDADMLFVCDSDDLLLVNGVTDDVPTVTGLCLALDLTRQGLINYEERDEFIDTVKKAKLRIENSIEQRLFQNNVAGTIFNLKNNFGWKDKTEVEQTASLTIQATDKDERI